MFIESIITDKAALFDMASKVQRIPFYVAMMLGDQAQRETYAKVLLKLSKGGTSDDISRKIPQANEKLFTDDMCMRILQSVPQVAMYEEENCLVGSTQAKESYLERNWDLVRDNVEFTREVDSDDLQSMEILRWLQK